MSDSLVDWFKDRVTPLYESVSASGEGALSSRVGSLFEGDARIICNHEEVDLATFSKGLVASSSAVSEAHVEWKKVASLTAAQHSDAQQVGAHSRKPTTFFFTEIGCHCQWIFHRHSVDEIPDPSCTCSDSAALFLQCKVNNRTNILCFF